MKIIDLSMQISEELEVYPGDPEVEFEQFITLDKDGSPVRACARVD